MKVIKTSLKDCLIIEPDVFEDDRGFFLESYHYLKYSEIAGIKFSFVQDNHSHSQKGVLRGLHFQKNNPQGKLVSVIKGCVYDVAVDIRKKSKTYGSWEAFELSEKNKKQLWVPPGFAHGFVVLSESADVVYKCTDYYDSSDEGSIIWNDNTLNIDWPITNPILSHKDSNALSFIDI